MAEYNFINSTVTADLIEGTEGNDSIKVYGNHSTVQAMGGNDIISVNGGRHDNGIWIEGDETNLIYAGDGNDYVYVKSRGSSIYGGDGNDTIDIDRGFTFADGGDGDDLFYINSYYNYYSLPDITVTGGEGKDTLEIYPENSTGYPYSDLKINVTDFSNDDVFRQDGSYYLYSGASHRVLTQSVQNGNVVISNDEYVSTYKGNTVRESVTPTFSVTLQGVSDISEVADAKYYFYENNVPRVYKTFGELFGVSAIDTTPPANEPPVDETLTPATEIDTTPEDTITSPETEPVSTTTTTIIESTTNVVDTTPAASGGDTIINNNYYYGDYYDMSGNNGTIINQSTVTGDVTNNTSIDNSMTLIKEGDTYTYSGGDKVINNYQQGERVELASDYKGIGLNGDSFFVNSSSGSLEIQNSRNKFVEYSMDSEVVAYSYVAGYSGVVDGRDKSQLEIMIGADNSNNQIYAGAGGSSMWGGIGGNDTMIGGAGYNEFFYMAGDGFDVIQSSNSDDLVNLAGVSFSQISDINVNVGQVNINFVDGGNLKVNGDSGVRYQISEGTFSVNQHTKEWSIR